ncbi:MAG: hypothetical protein GY750_16845 [Lentisphaerae bacterium]|nr:hypothetical protein [Lentisphaerota bacterium]MCP4103065.1 hypothetical protein [Lentisphaerota bacterium]
MPTFRKVFYMNFNISNLYFNKTNVQKNIQKNSSQSSLLDNNNDYDPYPGYETDSDSDDEIEFNYGKRKRSSSTPRYNKSEFLKDEKNPDEYLMGTQTSYINCEKSIINAPFLIGRRRKLHRRTYQNRIKMCLINLPYVDNDSTEEAKKLTKWALQYYDHKKNMDVINSNLNHYLQDVVPHSVIYLNLHGSTKGDLSQEIYWFENSMYRGGKPHSIFYHIPIKVEQIGKIFCKFIPQKCHNNLKIHLTVCHGAKVVTELMNYLHKHGFKRTSVVGYKEVVATQHGPCVGGIIGDIYQHDRNVNETFAQTDSAQFDNYVELTHYDHMQVSMELKEYREEAKKKKNPNYKKDNKLAAHNYDSSGKVITEEYFSFKNKHLLPGLNQYYKNIRDRKLKKKNEQRARWKLEHDIHEKSHDMIILLIVNILEEIKIYKEKRSLTRERCFSSLGTERVEMLKSRLEEINVSTVYCLNRARRRPAYLEARLIIEMINFANQSDCYSKYKYYKLFRYTKEVQIGLQKDSFFTRLLTILDLFFQTYHKDIDSVVFSEFAKYLSGSHLKRCPATIFPVKNNFSKIYDAFDKVRSLKLHSVEIWRRRDVERVQLVLGNRY